jgi:hypothetical protein
MERRQIQSCFYKENKEAIGIDIMKGENFDSPQKTFGGDEDIFGHSKSIFYVRKKERICSFHQHQYFRIQFRNRKLP